jgi:hypothetical protein
MAVPGAVAARFPLPALLSQALVAFTIEYDNEFEHQMPHRTARGPAAHSLPGPWLVSLPMWSNFMQFLPEAGAPLRELADLPRLTNLAGLDRWGYVMVEPDPGASRAKLARLTPRGRQAQASYRRLLGVVEERWQARFGADDIGRLRHSLEGIVDQSEGGQPRLSQGLMPYPEGWRAHKPYLTQTTAMLRDPSGTLPHYPMVSHRGWVSRRQLTGLAAHQALADLAGSGVML